MNYYLYILQCSDGSLYTGITTDLERRLSEHNGNGSKAGAKYTSIRRPVVLLYSKEYPNRSEATKAEYKFKQLPRNQKLEIIATSDK